MSLEKPLAGSNPMLHFQIRAPSTGVRPPTTLFHGLRDLTGANGAVAYAGGPSAGGERPDTADDASLARGHPGPGPSAAGIRRPSDIHSERGAQELIPVLRHQGGSPASGVARLPVWPGLPPWTAPRAGRGARRSSGHATARACGPLCPERVCARRSRPLRTVGHGFARSTDDTHSGCPCKR